MRILKVLLLALVSTQVFAGSENDFESVTVGLKVAKPAAWQFTSADEHLANMKKIQLNDREFQEAMQKYATAPLVVIMKYPEPYDDLNPSLKVNIRPLGQFKGADPRQIMSFILPQLQRSFRDFVVVQEPVAAKVSGMDAAYMQVNYSLVIPDGRQFPTTSEMWIVPRGDFFFMIGAGTRQDEQTGSRQEIREILDTLEISH